MRKLVLSTKLSVSAKHKVLNRLETEIDLKDDQGAEQSYVATELIQVREESNLNRESAESSYNLMSLEIISR